MQTRRLPSRPRHRSHAYSRALLVAATFAIMLPPLAVHGQEGDELIEESVPPKFGFLGQGGFIYQGDADLDRGGSVQVYRYDLGVVGRTDLMEQLRWSSSFFFGANDYNFDSDGFIDAEPWGTILNLRLGTQLTYMFNQQWGITGGGIFIFSPETSADWGDSFTGGGLVAGEYRHSETFFVSFGVAVISQIEDDPRVTPSVGLKWLPDDHWTLLLGAVPASGGAATAAEVAYRIIDPLDLGFGVVYQQRRFRLNDSGPVRDGVGEDNYLPIRLRLGWYITQHVSLHFLGGVAVAGELKLDDRNGNRLASDDYDPAAYVGVRLMGGF